MKTTLSVILTAAVLVCFAQVAKAAPITVVNGDFNAGVYDVMPVGSPNTGIGAPWVRATEEGWAKVAPDYDTWPQPSTGHLGNLIVGPTGNVSQVLATTFAAGTYTLSADLSTTWGATEPTQLAHLSLVDASTGTVLGTQAWHYGDTAWHASVMDAVTVAVGGENAAAIGHAIKIVLTSGDGTVGGYLANAAAFDNVALDFVAAPVPEPGTLVMLAAGLFGLLAYAWRKRK